MKHKAANGDTQAVRLDKWVWVEHFYKTRAQAREMIEGGKGHYNDQRSKPSNTMELGAEITLRQGNDERQVRVRTLIDASDA